MAFERKFDGKGKIFFDEWAKIYLEESASSGLKGSNKTSPSKSSPSLSPKRLAPRNSINSRF